MEKTLTETFIPGGIEFTAAFVRAVVPLDILKPNVTCCENGSEDTGTTNNKITHKQQTYTLNINSQLKVGIFKRKLGCRRMKNVPHVGIQHKP